VFVGGGLPFAGGHQEVACLVEQAIAAGGFAEDLEIPCFEMAGVFFDLVEIRIDAPLADLVGDDRRVPGVFFDGVAPVEIGARRLAVDDR
jgi:hypothetical protein